MKTLISKDVISKLKPCADRYDNYLKHYKDKSFTKAKFMGLKNITQDDKLWVAFRLMSKDSARLAAIDIAESVLHIFESKHPNDLRPRKAIAAARRGDTSAAYAASASASVSASAAYAFAFASDYVSAYAAASAVAYAACAAAYASADASASAVAYATSACTYAGYSAEDTAKQDKLVRKILLKYWVGNKT